MKAFKLVTFRFALLLHVTTMAVVSLVKTPKKTLFFV